MVLLTTFGIQLVKTPALLLRSRTSIQARVHCRPSRLSNICGSLNSNGSAVALLDRFWLARGVVDADQRRALIAVGVGERKQSVQATHTDFKSSSDSNITPPTSGSNISGESSLPGVALTWGSLDGTSAFQVTQVSQRIVDLHQLLGGKDDIDVVWMVEREPGLLTSDIGNLTRRLVELRTSEAGAGLDIVKLVEAQPALLLLEGGNAANSNYGGMEESASQRQAAWSFGLLGDGDREWTGRLQQLAEYKAVFGDCHVGYRDGDEPSIVRWACKQRQEHNQGVISKEREAKLREIGFEFDADKAEWYRWYNQLKAFQAESGHCTPAPLAAGSGKMN